MMNWKAFNTGQSIGQSGNENGTIIRDEEYLDRARITLEQGTPTAPFAITCGIYGWMVHTHYFSEQEQANLAFEQLEKELAKIVTHLANGQSEPEGITSKLDKLITLRLGNQKR